ncbi:MAG: TSCPD domain-containing protein, partial [Eggerthellaceae bacterium]
MYSYKTRGTCSRSIQFDVVDGVVRDVRFEGGCNGNLKGIGKLV